MLIAFGLALDKQETEQSHIDGQQTLKDLFSKLETRIDKLETKADTIEKKIDTILRVTDSIDLHIKAGATL